MLKGLLYPRHRSSVIVNRALGVRGIKGRYLTRGRLCRFTEAQFDRLWNLVDTIAKDTHITRVKIFRPESLSPQALTAYDKGMVLDALKACVDGTTLDLTLLDVKLRDQLKIKGIGSTAKPLPLRFMGRRGTSDALLNEILIQADIFEQIASNPSSTIEDVFAQIDKGKKRLGFLNVAVYRPKRDEDGSWVLTQRTQEWTEELSKYDPQKGGARPSGTLASILEAPSTLFDVDLCKPNTFAEQGIYYDDVSAQNDFEHAKGSLLNDETESRRMLYIKIQSQDGQLFSRYGTEGVILFHNQVAKKRMQRNPAPLLPEDQKEAEQIKKLLRQFYVGKIVDAIEKIRGREMSVQRQESVMIPRNILVPRASKLLTDDLLFNSKSGLEYPRSATEYHDLMAKILDNQGRFPGDHERLSPLGTFTAKGLKGAAHVDLNRRGTHFHAEIFFPQVHTRGLKNRIIFDADFISQAASFDAYGVRGVSYDRESYYARRLFACEKVPFIWVDGWPISFAAIQGFDTTYEGKELYYAFIHFVMTYGAFQGSGLTSYSVREGISSLFYRNIWHNRPNLMLDENEKIKDSRLKMWTFAHSGRFTPFYVFMRSFGSVNPNSAPITESIIRDVHQRITPAEDIERRRLVSLGVSGMNGGSFPLAVDEGVYPVHNRYPVEGGNPLLPQSELNLSSSVREAWFKAIGEKQGLIDGNGLYFGGLVTFCGIRKA